MRGFSERLKKGRLALAALGVVSAMAGSAMISTAAVADDGYYYHDRDWRGDRYAHERWERERWRRIEEERAREWRWRHRYDGPVYYSPPPAYYAPRAYYGEPSVGFGFSFH